MTTNPQTSRMRPSFQQRDASKSSRRQIPTSAGTARKFRHSTRAPRLRDQLRGALHSRDCSPRTEQTCCLSVERSIYFHNVRHTAVMAEPEITLS